MLFTIIQIHWCLFGFVSLLVVFLTLVGCFADFGLVCFVRCSLLLDLVGIDLFCLCLNWAC